jgi:hypothetical protein
LNMFYPDFVSYYNDYLFLLRLDGANFSSYCISYSIV